MYSRLFCPQIEEGYFLFGPRGTGKTLWLRNYYPKAAYIDLLNTEIFNDLRPRPSRLWELIPKNYSGVLIIDEIQKLPELLDEIHRFLNNDRKKIQFILTGSSARKLRRTSQNLLAGRLRYENFYPMTCLELGADFELKKALKIGLLPEAWTTKNPKSYLESYLKIYVDQEVRLEGLARNMSDFSRFLESVSLSQGSVLNISNVASDSQVPRKTVESYFEILEDLLIGYRLPVFQKKSKRELIRHNKFYLFDVGLYQTIRPRGVLDSESEIGGAVFETLIFQNLIAIVNLKKMQYQIFFWRTRSHIEVDFVLYGQSGFKVIEVKSGSQIRKGDLDGLLEFKKDYPKAQAYLVYAGSRNYTVNDIEIIPIEQFFKEIIRYLS